MVSIKEAPAWNLELQPIRSVVCYLTSVSLDFLISKGDMVTLLEFFKESDE